MSQSLRMLLPTSILPDRFDGTGWRTIHATFAAASPEPINIVDETWTTAWSISAFLLSLFLAWLCRIPARPYIVLTAIAAALALYLPTSFVPAATGALWGLLLSPICCRMLSQRNGQTARDTVESNARLRRVGLVTMAIVALLALARHGVCCSTGNRRRSARLGSEYPPRACARRRSRSTGRHQILRRPAVRATTSRSFSKPTTCRRQLVALETSMPR